MNIDLRKLLLPAVVSTLVPSAPVIANSFQIEEIVVTATRRAENLQDVPIAISAFTSNELAASGITTIGDLQAQTPGLSVANQAATMTVFIRGVGSPDPTAGQEGAIATYVDGVYIASPMGAMFEFNNIDRVEVLKGPQGTLFGRNATGGLIHIITRDPSAEPTMQGSVSYGNYDTVEGKLYGSMGLTDNVAADLALLYRNQNEGYGRNIDTGRETGFAGDKFGARTKVLATPGDDTTITFSADYFRLKNGDVGVARNIHPGTSLFVNGATYSGDYYDITGDNHPLFETETWGAALTIAHEFGAFEVKSITAYRELEGIQRFDNDSTALPVFNVSIDQQVGETFTQEVQLLSAPDSPFKWILGAFYLKDESGFGGTNGIGIFGGAFAGDGIGGVQIKNLIETESYALFGESTFSLTESTDLTLGLRWTNDERTISGKTEFIALGDSIPGGTVIDALPSPTSSFDEESPSWRVVLEHSFSDETMGYFSYNRGFKSGNFTTTDAAAAPFLSEEIDAYEIGMKTQLLDGRLQFNAAVFYYDYTNLQQPNFEGGFLITSNAGGAEIRGLDIEGQFLATEQLRFRFGASLLDSEYTDFPAAPCTRPLPIGGGNLGGNEQFSCDVSGNEVVRSPDMTYNLAAYYSVPLKSGSLNFNLAYSYNGEFSWTVDKQLEEDAYHILNGQVGWRSADEQFGVLLFGKNLLDEEYSAWTASLAPWGDTYAPSVPRTYGVEFSFAF